jgi:hypothetical protein
VGKENHDRLDKIQHTHEYGGMLCGSMGYIVARLADGSIDRVPRVEDGVVVEMEPKYCAHDCPTLIAAIKAS